MHEKDILKKIAIKRFKGKEIIPYIPELAQLRITIFKEYPYLYVGDLEYEKNYLQTYVKCPESIMVVVFDNKHVVGAATAIPLEFETAETQKPFLQHKLNPSDYFYLGELILLPAYRGQGICRFFIEECESAAREYGCKFATLCAVERDPRDPRRPKNYVSPDGIWRHFNYVKHPELCAYYEWKEIGEETQSAKPMIFWLKTL